MCYRRRVVATVRSQSGVLGVSWATWARKWRAQIHVGGRNFSIGYYPTQQEASRAYKFAQERLLS